MRGSSRFLPPFLVALAVLLIPGEMVQAAGLTITADANAVVAGTVVTMTISPKVLAQGDHVTFDFGDGETGQITYATNCSFFGGCATIAHAWAGSGTFLVIGSGTLGGVDVSGSLTMTIHALQSSVDLYVPTGAHVDGLTGTVWRTDLEVHNYGHTRASYTIALLPRGGANPNPVTEPFTLLGSQSRQHPDIVSQVFGRSGGAALRIRRESGSIMVTSRTYNQTLAGTYGQQVPAIPVAESIRYGQTARLIGLHHDPSLAAGYRTNVGLVNTSPAPITVHLSFYDRAGLPLGVVSTQLLTGEYKQFDRAFEQVTQAVVSSGYVILETTTVGGGFVAFASVIDNLTGDPVLVTPQLVE